MADGSVNTEIQVEIPNPVGSKGDFLKALDVCCFKESAIMRDDAEHVESGRFESAQKLTLIGLKKQNV